MVVETIAAMTLEQAAEYLQVTVDDLTHWLERGELPGVRLPSGEWRVPRHDLDHWLSRGAWANVTGPDAQAGLERADELRARILARRGGEPLPCGWSVKVIREGRS